MGIEDLKIQIRNDYKTVQNYLKGDPGTEGFLDSLADLQIHFADYLIEILKTEKDPAKSKHIKRQEYKGQKYRYIDDEGLEEMISHEVLGEEVSINSIIDKGIKRLEELFTTQESFKEDLEVGNIKNIKLDGVILPPNNLPTPITGSGKGFEKKELEQNKLRLFISILRELGIHNNDLIVYSGATTNNMMKQSSYYAIFIPKLNKTIFLNVGCWEATFVCEGEISVENMTRLGKDKLQSELGAKKINFSENNIDGWKSRLTDAILGQGGNDGENKGIKKETKKKKRNKIYSKDELHIIKQFYDEHKDDVFEDSEGKPATIKKFFSNLQYYQQNYEIVNHKFGLKLPAKPRTSYEMTWNKFREKIGYKFATIEEIQSFYLAHKDKDIVKNLFSGPKYYIRNYETINNDESFGITLPANITHYYNMTWDEFKEKIGIPKFATIEELIYFYTSHKDEDIVKTLFSSAEKYKENYKIINSEEKYGIKLPSNPCGYYEITRNEFRKRIGVDTL